jgi:hypothetical protein
MKRQIPKTNKTVTVSCVGEHPTSAKQVGVLHLNSTCILEITSSSVSSGKDSTYFICCSTQSIVLTWKVSTADPSATHYLDKISSWEQG